MSVGKYSPTVAGWYSKDQNWHTKHCEPGEWYDRDGYDSYGYNKQGKDRAGYTEDDYLLSGAYNAYDEYTYELYDDVWSYWRNKPVPTTVTA